MTKFDKQLNDYRSQVLWRIKDCEELLKNRVAAQELQDQMKALEKRLNANRESELEHIEQKIHKSKEDYTMRIKTCEIYAKDKINDMKEQLKGIEF